MGLVLGKITVETPKYQVTKTTPEYEIREYEPSIIAEVTYDPKEMKGDKDGGFRILANYIGALGKPQNTKPEEKIAMTAPVITKESAGEKIAMTAPVITREEVAGKPESIAMTAPVITKSEEEGEGKKLVTMQFLLPGSKYSKLEDVPKPTDPRVVIREEGGRKYGVVTFNGVATEKAVQEKLGKLKSKLEEDGYSVVGQHLLARYNPPWTLPPLRTNEIFVPVARSH